MKSELPELAPPRYVPWALPPVIALPRRTAGLVVPDGVPVTFMASLPLKVNVLPVDRSSLTVILELLPPIVRAPLEACSSGEVSELAAVNAPVDVTRNMV